MSNDLEIKFLRIERDKLKAENERLEAQVEALQNKCANRGLSPEDSDALQAKNERLRAALQDIWHRAPSNGEDVSFAIANKALAEEET